MSPHVSHPHPLPPPGRPTAPARPRPLLVTADPELLDDLLRLVAAAGAEAEVAADPAGAVAAWDAAPLVLVGTDAAEKVVRRGLARRAGTVLVGRNLDDATVWRPAVAMGAEEVVFLPDAQPWLIDRITDAVEGSAGPGATVCVVGGRGGAGASTLAAALALTASRRGRRSMLIDADPLGGGLDLVLGQEDAAGVRWPDLAGARGRLHADALRDALPRVGELRLLSWDRGDTLTVPAEAMQTALNAGRRGADLVVVDLPRRPDAAAEIALRAAGPVLLVVPAEVRATASAARVATLLARHTADLRVVVRGPAPARLSADVIAASLGLPLAGQLRPEPGLAAAQERGEPPAGRGRSPLGAFCARFLGGLERDGRDPAVACGAVPRGSG